MVPNTFAKWRRGTIQGNGRLGSFTTVKGRVPIAFFNKRTETFSGGVRTRIADARMTVATAFNEEIKEGDRFIVDMLSKRYRVESAESSRFGSGYYWYCTLMEVSDDDDPETP